MRPLTFGGYLEGYVAYLAGESTRDVKRLADLSRTNPRLRAPLVLWAVETDRAGRLARLVADQEPLARDLRTVVRLKAEDNLEWVLTHHGATLEAEYAKTWRSYVTRRDAVLRDASVKRTARMRALELEQHKKVTRYRLAKDLGLNPGNLHAFLAQGNVAKVSRANALRVVKYLEAA